MSTEELKKVRTREMKKAASILGADLVFLDYKDTSILGDGTLKDELIDVVRELKPDIILTFHPPCLAGRPQEGWPSPQPKSSLAPQNT